MYLLKDEFYKCPHKHTLYVKLNDNGDILILCLYVDDLIFTRNSEKKIYRIQGSNETKLQNDRFGFDVIRS